jgi:hypothetical protein
MLELPQSQIEIYDGIEVAQVISELGMYHSLRGASCLK